MKKRILFATNYNANDTTSWLRAFGPLTLPNMREVCEIVEPKIDVNDTKRRWWNNWRNWSGVDVCFMHRPFGPTAAGIMNAAKVHHVPLWVDHDDDILAISPKNPHYEAHHKEESQFPSVEYSYKEADILTCSGEVMYEELKTKYKRSDAILITTGLDDRFIKFKKPFSGNRKVGWRGSTSHKSDLEHFRPQLEYLVRNNQNAEWYWWGLDPRDVLSKETCDFMDGEVAPQRDLYPFIQDMCRANCSLHIVPLEDNKFNRVKSNLSWLDATLAGSVVIGPDFPEFRRPGIWKYLESDIVPCLEYALGDSSASLKSMHDASWSFIQDCLLTSQLNGKRIEILRNL